MSNGDTIRHTVSRPIAARPERVFDAWLDPALAARFLFATNEGQIIRADIDPVAGGEFCIVERRDDEDIEHLGEWVVLERPGRLAFDLSVNQSPVSRVSVEITADGKGGSTVTLTHELGAQWAAQVARAEAGWRMILDNLECALC